MLSYNYLNTYICERQRLAVHSDQCMHGQDRGPGPIRSSELIYLSEEIPTFTIIIQPKN